MFRIDNSTAAVTQPLPTPVGTPGYFTDGSAVGGVPATVVSAEFLNMLQEELINAAALSGEAPSKTAFDQVAKAIKSVSPGRLLSIQKFTTAGTATYIPGQGTRQISVIVIGGGGGGGGCDTAGASQVAAAGGAASGTYFESFIFDVPASPVTVTVGVGGGGGAPGINGFSGGTSSFGALISCPGGAPGGAGHVNAPGAPGGGLVLGPTATVPFIVSSPGNCGGVGYSAFLTSAALSIRSAGGGGGTPYSGGAIFATSTGPGIPAISVNNPGAGGGGALSANSNGASGGNGSAGAVFVLEYA